MARDIRAPRGTVLSCKGWQQEAALRMLMNNLEVAERPEELVVYGGRGKAARNWDCYDAIVRALRDLEGDETLLVQSGKPVGVFRTYPDAPRVLIANANLVPHWATQDYFDELDRKGLIMYGQMTAGSWIYIGTQGILQGTYETLAACAEQSFGGSLKGRLVLTAGLGGMGGAQPLAVTMNEGVALVAEVDESRIRRRLETRYLDRWTSSLDEALGWALAARSRGEALSIGVLGNAATVFPALLERGIIPDVVTDQTPAHDPLSYVPVELTAEQAAGFRQEDPACYAEMASHSMAVHVAAILGLRERGAIAFDYGNNLRQQAFLAGIKNAYDYPGFVPAYVRPLFCEGKGPFRWAALSGDPADIRATDEVVCREFAYDEHLVRWIRMAGERVAFQGLPARICWLGYGERARFGLAHQRHGGPGGGLGAHRHRARPSGLRQCRQSVSRDRGHARRLGRRGRLADPERADECGRRGHLGQLPPWGWGGHRVQPARRAGDRGRRDAGSGAPPGTSADVRSGHGDHQARRRRLPGRRGRRPPPWVQDPHAVV